MTSRRDRKAVRGLPASLLIGCVALALGVPSAGLALGGFDQDDVSLAARGSFASFTPASVDPRLARLISERATAAGRLMRFTPAGAANRPDRSVTVAVRVDKETAQAISVRSAIAGAQAKPGKLDGVMALNPSRYNLGLARGYRSFAQPIVTPEIQHIEMPDLASFAPAPEKRANPGRFNARIAMDEKANSGRAPRTIEADDQQSFDLTGSYRVLRNLDVTAGVRYSRERDRLGPLTDGTQDSQAVYVGTQFRF